ncbi:hypothetical protein J14TS2_17550 [Bacillus sp. J14TS2]|uniref:hypothetical protein n=1 Tax=Bacillus sp. J14TS2 TaxID=2807188 RepID=UPI001B2C125E|nr:hypothetical protein [Bacillus sp. J14TS2]GIN71280.1 hypothetical protein J14TS2_17550 [Bacillus sp. J14TS2]
MDVGEKIRRRDKKLNDLGITAEVLVDLHKKEPEKFTNDFIVRRLIERVDEINFDVED